MAHLIRYRDTSGQAGARCLDTLAAVVDPTPGLQALAELAKAGLDTAASGSCTGDGHEAHVHLPGRARLQVPPDAGRSAVNGTTWTRDANM